MFCICRNLFLPVTHMLTLSMAIITQKLKMHLKIILFLVLAAGMVMNGMAQSQFSGWLAAFNTIKLNNNFSFYSDVQVRSNDQWQHMQSLLLRPGLNYNIAKNKMLTAGYGYISNRRTVSEVSGYMPEHRIWEQFIVSHPVAFTSLLHRFRVEQRFIGTPVIENNDLKRDNYVYANRFRYFFRTIVPLSGEKKFEKGMFASLQNEVFLNFGNKRNVNGKTFDQNRAYASVGYRVSKTFDIETGYMNQYVSGKNDAITNNHILQLATYLRL
ncbi:DUF2490 domain-containing protein [Terrimonas sp.]|nr:DUF2490 domain-containing protein [Terrimonas sp.]